MNEISKERMIQWLNYVADCGCCFGCSFAFACEDHSSPRHFCETMRDSIRALIESSPSGDTPSGEQLRATVPKLSITHGDDGYWLCIDSPSGKHAGIHLEKRPEMTIVNAVLAEVAIELAGGEQEDPKAPGPTVEPGPCKSTEEGSTPSPGPDQHKPATEERSKILIAFDSTIEFAEEQMNTPPRGRQPSLVLDSETRNRLEQREKDKKQEWRDLMKKARALILSPPAKEGVSVSTVPYKCPVCEGSGQTIQQFIGSGTADYPHPAKCSACGGRGIVWNEPLGIRVEVEPEGGGE